MGIELLFSPGVKVTRSWLGGIIINRSLSKPRKDKDVQNRGGFDKDRVGLSRGPDWHSSWYMGILDYRLVERTNLSAF